MNDQAGYTLIELLIGIVISGIILSALGTAFIMTIRGTAGVEQRATESHDAQQVSAYLPADLQSVTGSNPDIASGTASGCLGTDPGVNLIRLSWIQDTVDDAGVHTSRTYYAAYRFDSTAGQLIRLYCVAGGAPDRTVVAHSLATTSVPFICGDRVSITFQETNGYTYTVAGSPRTDFGATPPCPPSVGVMQMLDADADGKVDRVVATFDTALTTGLPCTLGWTLNNVPSGGTLASVVISGVTATLNITEGAGAQNTAVGSFTIAFSPAPGCNAAGFGATAPTDRAGPVLLAWPNSVTSTNGNGKLETGDKLTFNFSEPVTGAPATTTITEVEATPDTISMPGVIQGTVPLGNNYVANNKTAVFAATVTVSGSALVVTAGACTSGCANPTAGSGVFSYAAASNIVDAAGNGVSASLSTPNSFKAF